MTKTAAIAIEITTGSKWDALAPKTYKITLGFLARMFVDYDRIESAEWDDKYGDIARALSAKFNTPMENTVVDDMRTYMEALIS